ncbi:MAG: glycosyltransferase family 39 protein [Candidatus Omnitrophota bacterium]
MRVTSILSIAKKTNPYLLLLVFTCALYLPSSFFRAPFAPDEFRNIYIAKNISTPHDYLFPKYVEGLYREKPPFYFWILKVLERAPVTGLLTMPVFFNALVSWGILSLCYAFFARQNLPRVGYVSAFVLATTGLFYGMNVLVRMDILFIYFIFLSIYLFWCALARDRWSLALCAALTSFLAVFTKGAFGILFPLFIEIGMAVFARSRKAFIKALGVNILAASLIFVWLISFSQLDHDYLSQMFFRQTVARGVNPFSHAEPWYYYLIYMIPVFLPWSFLLFGYLAGLRRRKIDQWEKIYLLWFFGGLFFLSLVRSKLEMYLLLLAIPFAVLAGKFLTDGLLHVKNKILIGTAGFFAIASLVAFFIYRPTGVMPPSAWVGVTILVALCVVTVLARPHKKVTVFFVGWVIFIQLLNTLYLPAASNAGDYKRILDTLRGTNITYQNICVTEKSLLALSIYPLRAPLSYCASGEKACQHTGSIIVTKDREFPCSLVKISEIKEFTIFYKQ